MYQSLPSRAYSSSSDHLKQKEQGRALETTVWGGKETEMVTLELSFLTNWQLWLWINNINSQLLGYFKAVNMRIYCDSYNGFRKFYHLFSNVTVQY